MLEGGHPASTMLSPRPRPASLPQPAPKAFLRSFPALCLSCHHQPQGDRPDHPSLLSKSEAALEALSCPRGPLMPRRCCWPQSRTWGPVGPRHPSFPNTPHRAPREAQRDTGAPERHWCPERPGEWRCSASWANTPPEGRPEGWGRSRRPPLHWLRVSGDESSARGLGHAQDPSLARSQVEQRPGRNQIRMLSTCHCHEEQPPVPSRV